MNTDKALAFGIRAVIAYLVVSTVIGIVACAVIMLS